MPYLLQHVLWFFLPGLLLAYLCRPCRIPYLAAFALSYGLLLLTLLPLEYLGADTRWFSRLLGAELAALVLLAGAKAVWRCRRRRGADAMAMLRRPRRRLWACGAAALLAAVVAGYWMWAGPYAEIPADVWSHLGRIQDQAGILDAGRFPGCRDAGDLVSGQGRHGYFVAAWLCRQSGMPVAAALRFMMLANALTFVLGIFAFGVFLFRRVRRSRLEKAVVAAVAALFCVAQMGVNVFSYVRYYTLAPALLNYVVFLAAMAVWISFLEDGRRGARGLWLLPLFIVTMLGVHVQEAVFAGALMFAVSLASAALAWRRDRGWRAPLADKRALSFLLLGACGWAAWLWLRRWHPAPVERPDDFLAVAGCLPLLNHALILNPLGQFFEVITVWGLFVYLAFLLRFRAFLGLPAIVGGMLLPLLTVFNPLVVDMFLRYGPSAPSLVYRLGYAVPLAYVAGFLGVAAVRKLVRPPPEKSALKQGVASAGRIALLAGLVLLLLPFPGLLARQSRLPTLGPVPAGNSAELWADLLAYLRTLPPKRLMADPVTAYVVRGLTQHAGLTDKFSRSHRQLRAACSNDSLAAACRDITEELGSDWLLIVNRRDGALSRVGQLSGHWPADALKVSRYYPPAATDYIRRHPEVFVKLWERDRIAVYDIDEGAVRENLSSVPELLAAEPALFEGPGIRLDWTSVAPQSFRAYHIQASTNGVDWRDLNLQREYCYSWLNHQGARSDAFGKWTYCLPSGQTYYYRVRAIYESGPGRWSNVKSAAVDIYR